MTVLEEEEEDNLLIYTATCNGDKDTVVTRLLNDVVWDRKYVVLVVVECFTVFFNHTKD